MSIDPANAAITTYEERGFRGRRSFALFPDHVLVSGRSFHGDIEFRVDLATLDPHCAKVRVRSRNFGLAILMTLFSLIIIAMIVFMDLFVNSRISHDAGIVVASLGALFGLFLVMTYARKVEFVSFRGPGGTPILDVARIGPEQGRFDEFVTALVQRMKTKPEA